MFLVPSCSWLCPIHWSQVWSRYWRCSWSSADRRLFNYICVINNFIAYLEAPYIRVLTLYALKTICTETDDLSRWELGRHCRGELSGKFLPLPSEHRIPTSNTDNGKCPRCQRDKHYNDQRKHQSSASLAFVRGIHRWPVNSQHKWPVTRKMFPFDDVIMGMIRSQTKLCKHLQIPVSINELNVKLWGTAWLNEV